MRTERRAAGARPSHRAVGVHNARDAGADARARDAVRARDAARTSDSAATRDSARTRGHADHPVCDPSDSAATRDSARAGRRAARGVRSRHPRLP